MEFRITKKNKRRARRRRIKYERKWIPFRVIALVSFVISITILMLSIFVIPYESEELLIKCIFVYSITLVLSAVCEALLYNLASRWVTDRLNERIWIEDGLLYHFIQKGFSGGLNKFRADNRATVYVIDMKSIRNAKYDARSGRIEFNATGMGIDYSNYKTDNIERQWGLTPNFLAIFYDYTEPSLYIKLKEFGVLFEEQTIDFKLLDARI